MDFKPEDRLIEKHIKNNAQRDRQNAVQFSEARKERENKLNQGSLRKSKEYQNAANKRHQMLNLMADKKRISKKQRELQTTRANLNSDLRRAENSIEMGQNEALDRMQQAQKAIEEVRAEIAENQEKLLGFDEQISEAKKAFLDARKTLKKKYINDVEALLPDLREKIKEVDELSDEIESMAEQVSWVLNLDNMLSPGVISAALPQSLERLHRRPYKRWKNYTAAAKK